MRRGGSIPLLTQLDAGNTRAPSFTSAWMRRGDASRRVVSASPNAHQRTTVVSGRGGLTAAWYGCTSIANLVIGTESLSALLLGATENEHSDSRPASSP